MEDIYFSESISANSAKYFIMDLPQELLLEVENHTLYLSGKPSDEAIICGSQSSYLLKKNETTNSLLVTEKNKVIKVCHELVLCEKIIPPLHQVYFLLSESPYTFQDQSKVLNRKSETVHLFRAARQSSGE